jgi:hypothetical protein
VVFILFYFLILYLVGCITTAQCKTWVCGRSLAGITGSNPAGCIDVCLLSVLCVVG